MPHPKTVLRFSQVLALAVSIALSYYVGSAIDGDVGRSFVVALCIVFTCWSLIPFAVMYVAMRIAKWHNKRTRPTFSNLERV